MAPRSSRPARRATGTPRRGAQVAPVRGAPWRAVLLVGVLAMAAWIAVPPFAGWWTQRAEIQQVWQESAAEQARTRELVEQREELRDDAHVRDLARTRLDYAEPGEKRYHVLTQGENAAAERPGGQDQDGTPWYQELWGSVEQSAAGVADDSETVDAPGDEGDSSEGAPAGEEPVREKTEPVPTGVPELITEDGFDPADIPAEDLSAGEDEPAAEGEQ